MSGVIPYTHWSYFDNEDAAKACAAELADYVIRIREPWEEVPRWLLLAGRDVAIDDMIERHNEVQAIVERHGGVYDYGESTWDTCTGKAVADPVLTGEWELGKGG